MLRSTKHWFLLNNVILKWVFITYLLSYKRVAVAQLEEVVAVGARSGYIVHRALTLPVGHAKFLRVEFDPETPPNTYFLEISINSRSRTGILETIPWKNDIERIPGIIKATNFCSWIAATAELDETYITRISASIVLKHTTHEKRFSLLRLISAQPDIGTAAGNINEVQNTVQRNNSQHHSLPSAQLTLILRPHTNNNTFVSLNDDNKIITNNNNNIHYSAGDTKTINTGFLDSPLQQQQHQDNNSLSLDSLHQVQHKNNDNNNFLLKDKKTEEGVLLPRHSYNRLTKTQKRRLHHEEHKKVIELKKSSFTPGYETSDVNKNNSNDLSTLRKLSLQSKDSKGSCTVLENGLYLGLVDKLLSQKHPEDTSPRSWISSFQPIIGDQLIEFKGIFDSKDLQQNHILVHQIKLYGQNTLSTGQHMPLLMQLPLGLTDFEIQGNYYNSVMLDILLPPLSSLINVGETHNTPHVFTLNLQLGYNFDASKQIQQFVYMGDYNTTVSIFNFARVTTSLIQFKLYPNNLKTQQLSSSSQSYYNYVADMSAPTRFFVFLITSSTLNTIDRINPWTLTPFITLSYNDFVNDNNGNNALLLSSSSSSSNQQGTNNVLIDSHKDEIHKSPLDDEDRPLSGKIWATTIFNTVRTITVTVASLIALFFTFGAAIYLSSPDAVVDFLYAIPGLSSCPLGQRIIHWLSGGSLTLIPTVDLDEELKFLNAPHTNTSSNPTTENLSTPLNQNFKNNSDYMDDDTCDENTNVQKSTSIKTSTKKQIISMESAVTPLYEHNVTIDDDFITMRADDNDDEESELRKSLLGVTHHHHDDNLQRNPRRPKFPIDSGSERSEVTSKHDNGTEMALMDSL